MNLFFYLKVAGVILIGVLLYTVTYLYSELGDRTVQLRQANDALTVVGQAKAKSDKAQVELSKQIDQLHTKTSQVIVEVAKQPVVDEEKCISPVLRGVLRSIE